jgi:hypothetical protein
LGTDYFDHVSGEERGAMRVIYLLPSGPIWDQVVQVLDKERRICPVLFIGDKQSRYLQDYQKIPWYPAEKIKQGLIESDAITGNLDPLDSKILTAMSRYEVIAYEMMSRIFLNSTMGTFIERRWYFHRLIRISLTLLKWYRPNIIVAASGPHRVYDYILERVALLYGIPYIFPHDMVLPHLCCFTDSQYRNFNPKFNTQEVVGRKSRASPKMTNAIVRLRGDYAQGKPIMLAANSFFASGSNTATASWLGSYKAGKWRLGRCGGFLKALLLQSQSSGVIAFSRNRKTGQMVAGDTKQFWIRRQQVRTLNRTRRLRKWYHRNAESPDMSRKFAFFSASYQPERSSVPDGHHFFDNKLVFSILEKSVPEGWGLYFREHPATLFRWPIPVDQARELLHYEQIREACPRVRFIGQDVTPFELIDNCQVAIALTGTVLWEALIRGKPALAFGDTWLNHAPGVYRVRSLDDCRAALDQIVDGFTFSEERLLDFLTYVESKGANLEFYFRENARLRYSQGEEKNWQAPDILRMAANIEVTSKSIQNQITEQLELD